LVVCGFRLLGPTFFRAVGRRHPRRKSKIISKGCTDSREKLWWVTKRGLKLRGGRKGGLRFWGKGKSLGQLAGFGRGERLLSIAEPNSRLGGKGLATACQKGPTRFCFRTYQGKLKKRGKNQPATTVRGSRKEKKKSRGTSQLRETNERSGKRRSQAAGRRTAASRV